MGSEGVALAAAGWSRQCVDGKELPCGADMGLNSMLNAELVCKLQHFLGLYFLIYKMGNDTYRGLELTHIKPQSVDQEAGGWSAGTGCLHGLVGEGGRHRQWLPQAAQGPQGSSAASPGLPQW